MAVKVFLNSTLSKDSYAEGQKVQVQDGHLIVSDATDKTIAVYSPDSWHHADVKN